MQSMKWAWKITRLAGIDVYIHATFLLLVAWFAYIYWQNYGTLLAVIEGVTFILALFICVVMHEFGHALMARRFNIVTRHITLLPIGGVASMEKMPEKPVEEILVAIAGPLVNVVIAIILFTWIALNNIPFEQAGASVTGTPMVWRLLIVNVFLFAFNMLPAFPMDGGRVLRASLALKLPHHKATNAAANVGKGFAIVFGFLGILYNPFLLLIAIFLWFGASAENQMEQVGVSLGATTAADAMISEFHIIAPHENLARAIELTLATDQRDFPIGNKHEIVGLLSQQDMLNAVKQFGDKKVIGELELAPIKAISPDTPIQVAFKWMQENNLPVLAVVSGHEVSGLLSLDNIIEFIKIQQSRSA